MKSIVTTCLAVMLIVLGIFIIVSPDISVIQANALKTTDNDSYSSAASPSEMKKIIAKEETKELALSKLETLSIYNFNLPSNSYKAYRATNVSITEKGVVIETEDCDGFALEKGNIVRVNAICRDERRLEGAFFTVGYVKDGAYTSTSCGNMQSPITAWEILEDKDAGKYKIYIKADDSNINSNVLDIIITVEK